MKKILCAILTMSCAVSLASCGDSSGNSENAVTTENSTIYFISSKKSNFDDIDSWLTNMWNVLICDMDSYIKDGTSCTGSEYDVEYAISELKVSYKKKDEYSEFIHSLDNSDENNARLITAWDKMCEQLDILYNKVISETPKAKDTSYEYKTDLYQQYYRSFQKIESEISKSKQSSNSTSSSNITTESTTSYTTTKNSLKFVDDSLPESTKEYVDYIGEQIEITDVITMAAAMIGAEEGTSFKYNGKKFGIYLYNNDDPILAKAETGKLTFTLQGFGDYETNSSVNGNYIMIYDENDDIVVNVFNSLK